MGITNPSVTRKWTDHDIRIEPRLALLAIEYARNYEGTFDFLLSAQAHVRRESTLSIGMARGVLNCMSHDARIVMPDFPTPQPEILSIESWSTPSSPSSPEVSSYEDACKLIDEAVASISDQPRYVSGMAHDMRFATTLTSSVYHLISSAPTAVFLLETNGFMSLSHVIFSSTCGMLSRPTWRNRYDGLDFLLFKSMSQAEVSYLPEEFSKRRLCRMCDKHLNSD